MIILHHAQAVKQSTCDDKWWLSLWIYRQSLAVWRLSLPIDGLLVTNCYRPSVNDAGGKHSPPDWQKVMRPAEPFDFPRTQSARQSPHLELQTYLTTNTVGVHRRIEFFEFKRNLFITWPQWWHSNFWIASNEKCSLPDKKCRPKSDRSVRCSKSVLKCSKV